MHVIATDRPSEVCYSHQTDSTFALLMAIPQKVTFTNNHRCPAIPNIYRSDTDVYDTIHSRMTSGANILDLRRNKPRSSGQNPHKGRFGSVRWIAKTGPLYFAIIRRFYLWLSIWAGVEKLDDVHLTATRSIVECVIFSVRCLLHANRHTLTGMHVCARS